MKTQLFRAALAACITLLAACNGSNEVTPTPSAKYAVVESVAPDYSSQKVVLVDAVEPKVVQNDLYATPDKSDYTIETYGVDIYHMGRSKIDTIDKYSTRSLESLEQKIYQYSTQLTGELTSQNPYTIKFVNQEKAYVIRYDSTKILVVNPSATKASDFITGEIDLSAYKTDKESVSASDGIIVNGKLYVVMQRQNSAWTPQTAYVAVIDIATDSEIETNSDSNDKLKGIPLAGLNPNPAGDTLSYFDNTLYVATHGAYYPVVLTDSKIEKIDLTDFSVSEVLNASDISGNVSNLIGESVIVSANKGYFFASSGFPAVSSLYEFNPSTGDVIAADIAETASNGEGISDIELDRTHNQLWIAITDKSNPGLDVYKTETNEMVDNRIATDFNPIKIRFTVE